MHCFVIKYLTQPKLASQYTKFEELGSTCAKNIFRENEVLFGCLHYLHIFQIVFCIPTGVKSCKFKHEVAR